MSVAYFALLFALVSTTILEPSNSGFVAELGMAAAGVCLLAASMGASKADREHFLRTTANLRWVLIAIPLCFGAQLIPIGLSLAHPIWTTTYDALQGLPFGYVTADFSRTLGAFFLALASVALIAVTIALGRDRRRAEVILFVLSGLTALVAVLTIIDHRLHGESIGPDSWDFATSLSGLGVALNLAVIQLAAERAETRHAIIRSVAVGMLGLAGLLINGAVILGYSNTNGAVACALGVALFLLILAIRRLDLSVLAATAICVVAAVGAALVLTWIFEKGSGSPLLRLLPIQPGETRAVLDRLFADTRWFGAGAGAFPSIGRIYQSGDATGPLAAPSAAIALFVETGWIGFALAIAIVLSLLTRLVSGALRRGRDSFFPAAAAACLCFGVVQGFADPGLLRTGAIICLAAIVGLGLSQSVSQAAR
ncbi:hypothetical protein OZ411_35970 [Bradyrhizobium sp. Arg237L]|uniref:hypothetical protein n=1 Tax=Bradyrhizobium sp. Arg237L TaxID=3003352 RepID=UPI00249F1BC9|nr:hypothetical protein [Bradyrhizobium sp. Arg237L]MDI4238212.1 hypothetical protein [Bradyrhizobium sp. Arg237L]